MKHSQYLKFLTSTSRMGRGEFIKSCTKLITAGIVTRFTLLEGRVFASPEDHDSCNTVFGEQDSCNRQKQDECSGGGVPELDVCDDFDADYCPGGAQSGDACPPSGSRAEDDCASGTVSNDICNEQVDPKSDQCEAMAEPDDVCADMKPAHDECGTGKEPEDKCPPNGGEAAGDQCPGGDPSVDVCGEGGEGDECGSGSFGGEDDCNSKEPDECTLIDDDSCPDGTNTSDGAGGTDKCVGMLGSDQCTDGTDATDACTGTSYGLYDTCPGGGHDVDKCDSTSDDYCDGGTAAADVCDGTDRDDCPGCSSSTDVCSKEVDPVECAMIDICADKGYDTCTSETPDVPSNPE